LSRDGTRESLERLSLARPLADDVLVRREWLVLPDGERSIVLCHGGAWAPHPPVLYLHGIQSHPGWFVRSAQALARAGHAVFQVTRRGSGLTTHRRGDARSWRQLLDDVASAEQFVLRHTGARTLALAGVSWGGKLALAYVLWRRSAASSLTLIAPGIVSQVRVSPATKVAIALAACLRPRRTFPIPLNDPALFTGAADMQEYLRNDPLRLHRATARLMLASAVLDRRCARAPAGALALPTTLILARDDRIIDNAATLAAVQRLAAGRAEVVELAGCHTLEFEPDPAPLHAVLCRAVRRRAEGGG
jgi:alpha-beta hydrolase superfamily lysophospholipase